MANILQVKNQKFLESLPNHQDGEVAFCEEEQVYMIYKENCWIPVKAEMTDKGLQLNLYDLNKQLISQLPPLDEVRIQETIKALNDWRKANLYMLYGKEISYFTLISHAESGKADFDTFGDSVVTVLDEFAESIFAVDILNDSAVEIWVNYNDEPTVLYLFNYEDGMVTYGK